MQAVEQQPGNEEGAMPSENEKTSIFQNSVAAKGGKKKHIKVVEKANIFNSHMVIGEEDQAQGQLYKSSKAMTEILPSNNDSNAILKTIYGMEEDDDIIVKPRIVSFDVVADMNPSSSEKAPAVVAIPPNTVEPNPSDSSSFLQVVIPVLVSICIVLLLSVGAFKTWKRHKVNSKGSKSRYIPDSEVLFEEVVSLKSTENIGKDAGMQIVQEADEKIMQKEGSEDEKLSLETEDKKSDSTTHHSLPPDDPPCVTLTVPEEVSSSNQMPSEMLFDSSSQRPSSLKFLAAAAAFEASTVRAVKRLPYTPDPDYVPVLCGDRETIEQTEAVDGELRDKVSPLTSSPTKTTRMKQRGLLERRGSNVALTISLRSGDKNNTATIITSAKSPKPLAYLQKASCPLTPSELHEKSCDTAGLQKEFWEIPMNHPSEKHFNVAGHGTKNRYRTILPNLHSRVELPLSSREDALSTYINANYIRDCTDLPPPNSFSDQECIATPVKRENASFIATQGPMTNTVSDFWRMVWLQDVFSIVMITKLKERKEKCTQYLPVEMDETLSYGDVIIKVVSMRKYEHFTVRTLDVTFEEKSRRIKHFWYTTWMDHETPEKTRGLLELVQEVSLWNKPSHGPMVVHCSAGIGRTGCYIAVTVGCHQLMKMGKTDILRIVSQMRLDRGGMIQTWEQYQFVHQALSRYGRILAGENVTTPSTTGSIRSPPSFNCRIPAKEPLAIEIPGSQTPKQRRSLSEANLPSPKELKLNMKNATSLQIKCNTNFIKPAPTDKSWTSKQRKMKIQLPKSDAPPSSPLQELSAKSSPNIRSPFDQMSLQNEDINADSSVTNGQPEGLVSQTTENGHTVHEDSQAENCPKKAFNFTLSNSNSPQHLTHPKDTKLPLNNDSHKRKFAFDLPNLNLSSSVTHGNTENNLLSQPVKSEDSPKNDKPVVTATPGTTANLSHFVFPLPDKR